MNIYVSGSLAYDRIMVFPDKFSNHILPEKLHILNVCFLVNNLEEKFGGTAGNIAYSLALLQEKPVILSSAGSDFDRYQQWLDRHSILGQGIRRIENVPTAGAYITTDKSDNQITAFNPGAMNFPTYNHFDGLSSEKSLAIVSPGNLEDMQEYPRMYKQKGIPYIFDPGQNIPAFSGEQLREMIQGSAYLIVNDYELSLIMQSTGLDEKGLLNLTGCIVVTLGEKGSRILKDGEALDVEAVKVNEALDPTGAGDAFRSGFIKGLCLNKELSECARMGSVSASFCVEKAGTQEHRYTLDQFWERYAKNYAQ